MSKHTAFKKDFRLNADIFDLYDQMLSDTNISILDVLHRVTEVLGETLHAERATIYLIDKTTDELESAAFIGNVSTTIRIPITHDSLAGFCALSRQTFVVPDAYGDLSAIDPGIHFDRTWDDINQFRTRDVMCAPARFKDQVVGVVQVMNSTGQPFCEDDLSPLQNIARLIGYILYNARLLDDLASLKRLEQEKATFIRIMVHELKSPVNAAKSLVTLFELRPLKDPKIAHLPGRISTRLDQLLTLIKDLLELARVKSGDPLGNIAVLDLVSETRKGCEPYLTQAKQKGLELHMEYPDTPVQVRFDSQGYALVLSNLVSNAVKYTPEGVVRLTLKQQDTWAVLQVADSGIGIPEDDISQLFKEFFRASNAKRRNIQGTGVGLAGVKHIVERFGGELELHSRENEGSVFTVRLPLYSEGTDGR